MTKLSHEELVSHLTATGVLSDHDVKRRAAFLIEDLARIGLKDFALLPLKRLPIGTGHDGTEFYFTPVEYSFGSVPFNAQNAGDPFSVRRTVQEMSGTGLDRGDLLYLSKVCEIGQTLIPTTWFKNRKMLQDLAEPSKHLSTLNEIWWLSVWQGISEGSLQHDCKVCSTSSKKIDWRFGLTTQQESWFINLEVKQLVHTLANRVYQKPHYFYAVRNKDGSIREDDPSLKFDESGPNEVNVLAVTWFDDISSELELEAQEFLDSTSKIDAILFWAPGDKRRGTWYRMYPRFRDISIKRAVLHAVLRSPDDEDHSRIMWNIFPRTIDSILEESRNV